MDTTIEREHATRILDAILAELTERFGYVATARQRKVALYHVERLDITNTAEAWINTTLRPCVVYECGGDLCSERIPLAEMRAIISRARKSAEVRS